MADEDRTRLAVSCAICHASVDEDGLLSGIRANRDLDMGRLRLDYGQVSDDNGVDATAEADLMALGPGRSDVLPDGVFIYLGAALGWNGVSFAVQYDPLGPNNCWAEPVGASGVLATFAAMGDYDGDGDQELAIVTELGEVLIFDGG